LQVAALGRYRAEFCCPLDLIFRIKTYLRVCKAIRLRGRGQGIAGWGISFVHAHAIFRLVKAVVDPIIADLQAERIFHLTAKPFAENRMACVQSGHPAPVVLLELVAANGVCQVVSENQKINRDRNKTHKH
jgi:hypothetical protein